MAFLRQAELEQWRDSLRKARYSGVRRLRDQNGEEVEYRSDAEITRAIAAVEREITAANQRPASTIVFRTSKGL